MVTKSPKALNADLVGTYSALAKSGGGYVWDAVLEYRVWCYPHDGAEDLEDGSDYYYAFETFEGAVEFANQTAGTRKPVALIRQEEYIDEPEPGIYSHIKDHRITEWPVEFLLRPKRNENTIPDFISPDAPPDKLDILRGVSKKK